jgi:hypothetical protein
MISDIGYFNIFHPFFPSISSMFHPFFQHFFGKNPPISTKCRSLHPCGRSDVAGQHFTRVHTALQVSAMASFWRIHGERNNPTYYIIYILYLIYINFVFQEYLNSIWVRQPRFVFVQTFDICIFHRLGPWLTGSSSSSASKNPNENRWFSQRFYPAIFHISPGENPAKCGKKWEKSSWDTYLVISYIANWKITTSNR